MIVCIVKKNISENGNSDFELAVPYLFHNGSLSIHWTENSISFTSFVKYFLKNISFVTAFFPTHQLILKK